jgi:hypothetical protein
MNFRNQENIHRIEAENTDTKINAELILNYYNEL